MKLSELFDALDNGCITQEELDAIGTFQAKSLSFKRATRRLQKISRSEKGQKCWRLTKTVLVFISGIVATLIAQFLAFKLGWQ